MDAWAKFIVMKGWADEGVMRVSTCDLPGRLRSCMTQRNLDFWKMKVNLVDMTGSDCSWWRPVARQRIDGLFARCTDCADCSLAQRRLLQAGTPPSAINLHSPPRFAPLSHQKRAMKNELGMMKKRMRCILVLLLFLPLLFFLLLLAAPRRACAFRNMTMRASATHAVKVMCFRC